MDNTQSKDATRGQMNQPVTGSTPDMGIGEKNVGDTQNLETGNEGSDIGKKKGSTPSRAPGNQEGLDSGNEGDLLEGDDDLEEDDDLIDEDDDTESTNEDDSDEMSEQDDKSWSGSKGNMNKPSSAGM